jgi:Hint domain-containing protein
VPVERLRERDVVRTRLHGAAAAIVWLEHRRIDCARHPRPEDVMPVRVAGMHSGRTCLTATCCCRRTHAVCVDGILIPVRHLITATKIARRLVGAITYLHVELAAHDVILAEALLCESYLDTGDCGTFQIMSGPIRLFPDLRAPARHGTAIREARACTRMVVAGWELEAVRQRLTDVSEPPWARSADRF